MGHSTVTAEAIPAAIRVTLRRPERRNPIDAAFIAEVHQVLDEAERDPRCRAVIIRGQGDWYCSGMDFAEALGDDPPSGDRGEDFFGLLHRFTTVTRVVVSVVEGRATGGGVGLAAASDLVYASPGASFALPEALWGLLPCSVLPFLIRRVGFQRAYAMMLDTLPVSAAAAARFNLVDEVSDEPARLLRRLTYRLGKLDGGIIGDAKRYAAMLAPVPEQARRDAVTEFSRLVTSAAVQDKLAGFVAHGRMPWEP